MGPENAQILAQLSLLTKSIRGMGGGSEETPLRGKRGIVATPVQSNNLSNIYMRVL